MVESFGRKFDIIDLKKITKNSISKVKVDFSLLKILVLLCSDTSKSSKKIFGQCSFKCRIPTVLLHWTTNMQAENTKSGSLLRKNRKVGKFNQNIKSCNCIFKLAVGMFLDNRPVSITTWSEVNRVLKHFFNYKIFLKHFSLFARCF